MVEWRIFSEYGRGPVGSKFCLFEEASRKQGTKGNRETGERKKEKLTATIYLLDGRDVSDHSSYQMWWIIYFITSFITNHVIHHIFFMELGYCACWEVNSSQSPRSTPRRRQCDELEVDS